MKPVPIDVRLLSASASVGAALGHLAAHVHDRGARPLRQIRERRRRDRGLVPGRAVPERRLALRGGGRREPGAHETDGSDDDRRRRRPCGASTKLTSSPGAPRLVRRLIQQIPKLPLLGRRQPLLRRARVARHRRRALALRVVLAPMRWRTSSTSGPAAWRVPSISSCDSLVCPIACMCSNSVREPSFWVMPNQANASRATRETPSLRRVNMRPQRRIWLVVDRRTIWPQAGISSRVRSRRCNPATMARLEMAPRDRPRLTLENSPSMEVSHGWATCRSRQIFF